MRHQVEYGDAVKRGFERHGFDVRTTGVPHEPADLHVCIGPNFALRHWRNKRTLLLDRAYWGDPQRVSVHWLVGGERHWLEGDLPQRAHPDLKIEKVGERVIYLCDYGEQPPPGNYNTVRRHPANQREPQSLAKALAHHDIAVGRRSTAMVDAAIAGLVVRTDDPHSLVAPLCNGVPREEWILRLAWHNWKLKEIASGDMLDGIGSDYPTG